MFTSSNSNALIFLFRLSPFRQAAIQQFAPVSPKMNFNSNDLPVNPKDPGMILNRRGPHIYRVLMVDLEKRSKVGISLLCPLDEAIKLAQSQTRNIIYRTNTGSGEWYIHALTAGTRLPASLHLSRDSAYTSKMLFVTGHHSLDSLNGDTFTHYLEELKSVNNAFTAMKRIQWERHGCTMDVNYKFLDIEAEEFNPERE